MMPHAWLTSCFCRFVVHTADKKYTHQSELCQASPKVNWRLRQCQRLGDLDYSWMPGPKGRSLESFLSCLRSFPCCLSSQNLHRTSDFERTEDVLRMIRVLLSLTRGNSADNNNAHLANDVFGNVPSRMDRTKTSVHQ